MGSTRLATRADVSQVMALEARHFVGNLDDTERADGYISILHSQDWFDAAVDSGGLHVAIDDAAAVRGFIAITPPPTPTHKNPNAIIRAMRDLAEVLEFRGEPISKQRYAFRGPVLIDKALRGLGLYAEFNEVTRAAYRGQYEIGVLFVAAENERSVHTTTTKLGATSLTVFEVGGALYHFMAFEF